MFDWLRGKPSKGELQAAVIRPLAAITSKLAFDCASATFDGGFLHQHIPTCDLNDADVAARWHELSMGVLLVSGLDGAPDSSYPPYKKAVGDALLIYAALVERAGLGDAAVIAENSNAYSSLAADEGGFSRGKLRMAQLLLERLEIYDPREMARAQFKVGSLIEGLYNTYRKAFTNLRIKLAEA